MLELLRHVEVEELHEGRARVGEVGQEAAQMLPEVEHVLHSRLLRATGDHHRLALHLQRKPAQYRPRRQLLPSRWASEARRSFED